MKRLPSRQALVDRPEYTFNTCCQAAGFHRIGCTKAPKGKSHREPPQDRSVPSEVDVE